jgi:hypothetical protein
MPKAPLSLLVLLLTSSFGFAQSLKLSGHVYSRKMEPIPLVSVRVKTLAIGTTTNELGHFEITLPEGRYELVFSAVGYKPFVSIVVVKNGANPQRVILEEEEQQLQEVNITSNSKDRSKDMLRKVIEQKDSLMRSSGSFSFEAYIKASEKREIPKLISKGKFAADAVKIDSAAFSQFAEVHLTVRKSFPDKLKEIRDGMNIKGNKKDFYFLSFTEGDYNFYDNLIRIPSLSEATFLSPISRSGLLAYRYKYIGMEWIEGKWMYHIYFRPSKASNALLEGDVWIMDDLWVIYKMKAAFPNHLTPKFKSFEATVTYDFIQKKLWLPVSYHFSYQKSDDKAIGNTTVSFRNYNIDTTFNRKTFNSELSATTDSAYERDSTFWDKSRAVALTDEELHVIRYKDSVYAFLHSEVYQDSVEDKRNKITPMKLGYSGISYSNWRKEKNWYFPPAIELISPIELGGVRINPYAFFWKKFKSKRVLSLNPNISYGLLNKDIRGDLSGSLLYDPIKRSTISFNVGRNLDNIYSEDAFSYINMIVRKGYYLKDNLTISHETELLNGLYLKNTVEYGVRRSMSQYKFYNFVDSFYNNEENNRPIDFKPYSAFFYALQLSYTPFQMYLREPKEKVILGSKYPTFYAKWKIGIPNLLGSVVNYNYLELGVAQEVYLGTLGNTTYNLKYGNFLSEKNVEAADYKRISRGNPGLFFNPINSFQSMDSSFALFKGFGEFHLKHDFNGAIINKIPYAKKLKLFESFGVSALYAPERKLIYGEAWIGLEKEFRLFQQTFRIGAYAVSSWANSFQNPIQFKIGIRSFNPFTNTWR